MLETLQSHIGQPGRPVRKLVDWPSRRDDDPAAIPNRHSVDDFASVPIVTKSTVQAIRLARSRASHPSMANGPIGAIGASARRHAAEVSGRGRDAATTLRLNTVEPTAPVAVSSTRRVMFTRVPKLKKSLHGHLGSWPTIRISDALRDGSVSRARRLSTQTSLKLAP